MLGNKDIRTAAMVVGIGRYGVDSWDIGGPPADARRFALWLRSKGVPNDALHVFVSGAEADINFIRSDGFAVAEPTYANISNCLLETLVRSDADQLLIFWGGHGVTKTNEQIAFCADATPNNLLNFSSRNLLDYLASNERMKFRRQFLVFDLCAEFLENQLAGKPMPEHPLPFKGPGLTDLQQVALFAARPGHYSSESTSGQGGVFSNFILEALERSPNDQWPDFESIGRSASVDPKLKSQKPWRYTFGTPFETKLFEIGPDGGKVILAQEGRGRPQRGLQVRQRYIDGMHQCLAAQRETNAGGSRNVERRGIALVGPIGVGKTELAESFYRRHAEDFYMMKKIRSKHRNELLLDIYTLGRVLCNDDYLTDLSAEIELGKSTELEIGATRSLQLIANLELNKPLLLIFDDAQNPVQLDEFLPIRNVEFVVTSTFHSWDGHLPVVEVAPFDEDEAVELLCRLTGRLAPDHRHEALLLARDLDCLPLALHHAASYMIGMKRVSFAEYRSRLHEYLSHEPDTSSHAGRYRKSVRAAVSMLIQSIADGDPANGIEPNTQAIELLNSLSYLSPNDIPIDLIAAGEERQLIERSIAALASRMLIRDDGRAIQMLRTVQRVARANLSPAEEHKHRLASFKWLIEFLQGREGLHGERDALLRVLPHARTALSGGRLDVQDERHELLLALTAKHLQLQGAFEESRPYAVAALRFTKKRAANSQVEADRLVLAGAAYISGTLEDVRRANGYFWQAKELDSRLNGPMSAQVLRDVNNIAICATKLNKSDTVIGLLREMRSCQIDESSDQQFIAWLRISVMLAHALGEARRKQEMFEILDDVGRRAELRFGAEDPKLIEFLTQHVARLLEHREKSRAQELILVARNLCNLIGGDNSWCDELAKLEESLIDV